MKMCMVIIFLLSAYLALVRLDNALLWDDEAQVALIGRNFVKYKHLTAWTGRNLFAYGNGTIIDQDLRPINPPLDFLVAAASFSLFGVSTWAARFPFALLGLASLALFGWLLLQIFSDEPWAQVYCFGSLALSVTYLLYVRNCRYYSLAIFFALACYATYISTLKTTWIDKSQVAEQNQSNYDRTFFLLFALSAIGLFYAHYLMCVCYLIVLALTHFRLHRHNWPRDWPRNAWPALVLFLIATVPYALIFHIWERRDFDRSVHRPWLIERFIWLQRNFRDLPPGGYMTWLVFAGVLYYLWRNRNRSAQPWQDNATGNSLLLFTRQWMWLVMGFLVNLAMLTKAPAIGRAELADLRYMVTILPFCAGLTGAFLTLVHRRSPQTAVILFVVLLSCNVFALTPNDHKFRWLLPAYIREVHQPYPTNYSVTIDFLKKYAQQEDTIFAFPTYMCYALMFYMDDKLRFTGLLSHSTPLPPQAVRSLKTPMYIEENFPRWYIAFAAQDDALKMLAHFSRLQRIKGRILAYNYKPERILNVYYDQEQRPELPWHHFGPRRNFNRESDAIYVFRRGPLVPILPTKLNRIDR